MTGKDKPVYLWLASAHPATVRPALALEGLAAPGTAGLAEPGTAVPTPARWEEAANEPLAGP